MSQSASDPPNYLNIPGHAGGAYGDVITTTFPNTRLIVLENGLGILTNTEEEQISFVVSLFLVFFSFFARKY